MGLILAKFAYKDVKKSGLISNLHTPVEIYIIMIQFLCVK